jgi:geranylgeranyl diphosphate synthase type II
MRDLAAYQKLIEVFLQDQVLETVPQQVLLDSMRYSLLAGGKRLRPVLCMAFCEACGGRAEDALQAGAAIEMVHTYSLIHDDLPCMDNDDYRRGKLTNHKVYGDDVATLAGDALLTAAFRYLAEMDAPPERIVRCVQLLSQAAGENGMVAGQILDLEGEKRSLTEAELRTVHRHKTGDMISASCQMGAVLGGGSETQIAAAAEFAQALGMAFQIRDDMLDCMGTQEELGKPIGSDIENQKSTFVTLFGLEKCQILVDQETEKAQKALESGDFLDISFLKQLSGDLTRRRK